MSPHGPFCVDPPSQESGFHMSPHTKQLQKSPNLLQHNMWDSPIILLDPKGQGTPPPTIIGLGTAM